MPDNHNDNPYASPQSNQHPANVVKRQLLKPHGIVSFAIGFGFVVGAVSSYVRPMIGGPVHYEAIVALSLIVLFLAVAIAFCLATARPILWTSVVIAMTWFSYFAGWSLMSQRMWDDMIGVCVVGAGFSLGVVLPLVASLSWLRNRKGSA